MKSGKIFLILLFFFPVYLHSMDLGEIKSIYLKGVSFLANHDLVRAESNFNIIISLPSSRFYNYDAYKARSYYFLADIFFIQRNYEKAIDCYKKIVTQFYDEDIYSRSMYKLGRTLIIAGRNEEGIAMLNDYYTRFGNKEHLADSSLFWMARGYAAKGDNFKALQLYQLILTEYPSSPFSYEIRNSIESINNTMQEQYSRDTSRKTEKVDEIETLKENNRRMAQEKEILEKISRLLQIKQRLLEIKSLKVEALARLREEQE